MAVRSFYTDVTPNPDVGFLGDFLTGWVGQRAAENAEARAARSAGEDPAKLANLEMEIADTLGKLQEGKGKALGERDIQAMKTNAALVTALMGGYNATVRAQEGVTKAKIGARSSQYGADVDRYERTRARMGIGSDEQRHTLGTFQSAVEQAETAGPGSKEAQSVIDVAAKAALTQEGAGAAGERYDRVLYDLWATATAKGLTAEANHIAGDLMHVRGGNVEQYMAQRYGDRTPEQFEARSEQITRGGVGGFPFYRELDKAIKDAAGGSPETLTEHSERGPDDEDGESGEAPVQRKVKVKGGAGSYSFEGDLDAAARGDKGASDRIAAAFDAAIAEQRAAAEDIRKRREAALSQSGPSWLPTGNVLIDNPNTYTETYIPKAYGRAAMAPRDSVSIGMTEEQKSHGGEGAAEYARDYEMMGQSPPAAKRAPTKPADMADFGYTPELDAALERQSATAAKKARADRLGITVEELDAIEAGP